MPQPPQTRAFPADVPDEVVATWDVEDALDRSTTERLRDAVRFLGAMHSFTAQTHAQIGLDEEEFDVVERVDLVRHPMDVSLSDWVKLLRLLTQYQAHFVVIGGIALLRLVPYRSATNLDLLILATIENGKRVQAAIADLTAGAAELSAADLVGGTTHRFGRGIHFDILTRTPGTTWDEVSEHAEVDEFDGVTARFADVSCLIRLKEALSRPKDQADLIRLRLLRDRITVTPTLNTD